MIDTDILIIGAGAAGIAAAKGAWAAGCRRLLLVDAAPEMGGVLRQCAHHGFGAGLDGPDYIRALLADFPAAIDYWPETTVLALSPHRQASLARPGQRRAQVRFRQVILASGCYEIPIGALPIAGTRPRGIYTAGDMQGRMNLGGEQPPGPVVILGSGDLGLIMARQLAGLGLSVTLIEQRDHCGGLARNQHCLQSPRVQLRCGLSISEVRGLPELESVVLSDGSVLPCRTLLIAVGLRPERALLRGLGTPDWLHLCGNCRRVQPMIEAVVAEGTALGLRLAAERAPLP